MQDDHRHNVAPLPSSGGTATEPSVDEDADALAERLLSVFLASRAEQQQRLEQLNAEMAVLGEVWIIP